MIKLYWKITYPKEVYATQVLEIGPFWKNTYSRKLKIQGKYSNLGQKNLKTQTQAKKNFKNSSNKTKLCAPLKQLNCPITKPKLQLWYVVVKLAAATTSIFELGYFECGGM